MPKIEYELHRSQHSNGVTIEGHYERCHWPKGTPYWVLREWRLITLMDGAPATGDWHKIHGNKKKDIGTLKLLRDDPPTIAPMPKQRYQITSYHNGAKFSVMRNADGEKFFLQGNDAIIFDAKLAATTEVCTEDDVCDEYSDLLPQ